MHLLDIDRDQPLWRIEASSFALAMFESRRLTLASPARWNDPFEGFLGKCRVAFDDGSTAGLDGLLVGFYGQCWSTQPEESDALWRMYAPGNASAVRLRTTAGKLLDAAGYSLGAKAADHVLLGRVKYQSRQDILNWIEARRFERDILQQPGLELARTLLVKRTEFAHEYEARLLCSLSSLSASHAQLVSLACDPTALVEHITLDPRWTPAEASEVAIRFRRVGYAGPLTHSDLYTLPPLPSIPF